MPRTERPYMPEYGIDTDLDGVLPWSWAQERLAAQRNYWLATTMSDGQPHLFPVWGVWDTQRDRFWFGCAPTATKVRNLMRQPRVSVSTESTVECVTVQGVAHSLSLGRKEEAIAAFAAKYEADIGEVDEYVEFLRASALFEVMPTSAFGLIEDPDLFPSRATRWVW